MKKKVIVVGARGYAGIELVRILLKHEDIELAACFATEPFLWSDYLPGVPVSSLPPILPMKDLEGVARNAFAVFLATPSEISIDLAPRLLKLGAHVIDLSGGFRLKGSSTFESSELYKKWYGIEHSSLDALQNAVYGLHPWILASELQSKPGPLLVANPGCYATAIQLGLLPLLQENFIEPNSIVIDAKSGTSGAGRNPAEHLLFTEVAGECLPYKIGVHQHLPEICETAIRLTGKTIDPMMTTHLLNTRRGIIAGIYARSLTPCSLETLDDVYSKFYDGNPLVHFGAIHKVSLRFAHPLLLLRQVVGTAKTHIGYHCEGTKIFVFSSLDNLMKGAASQAVENLNVLAGLSAHTGLTTLEGVL